MRTFREVEDYQPQIIKAFEGAGWLCLKYPGNGVPDLIATKHPYGAWIETKVIHTDSKKRRVIDHFTHGQIPTYLDFSKRSVLSRLYLAIAFVTEIDDNRIIDNRILSISKREDVIFLKETDIDTLRVAAFPCYSVQDMVSQIVCGRFN